MKWVHFVGLPNSGKTTLVCEVVSRLTEMGLNVGSVKHTPHNHPIDKKGSDSECLLKSKAHPSCFVTCEGAAVFYARNGRDPDAWWREELSGALSQCDVVIIEGDKEAKGAAKIEVFYPPNGTKSLVGEVDGIAAVVVRGGLGQQSDELERVRGCGMRLIDRENVEEILKLVIHLSEVPFPKVQQK